MGRVTILVYYNGYSRFPSSVFNFDVSSMEELDKQIFELKKSLKPNTRVFIQVWYSENSPISEMVFQSEFIPKKEKNDDENEERGVILSFKEYRKILEERKNALK